MSCLSKKNKNFNASKYIISRLIVMSFVERKRPGFSEQEAQEIARSLYRVHGIAGELAGERDQNFHITDDSGKEFILKIAGTFELEATLDMQNRAMERLATATTLPVTNRVCLTLQNREMTLIPDSAGIPHFVRMLTYVPGTPLALFRPHGAELLLNLGRVLGTIDKAFSNFDHPAARRDLRWDYDRVDWTIEHFTPHIATESGRSLVHHFHELWKDCVSGELDYLRKSIIYNDANEYNVLVNRAGLFAEPQVSVIDFGDMLYTYTVAEVAVACAYAMLEKQDPLTAAAHVVSGYHAVFPLTEKEIDLLYCFISMRICLSVSIGAFQHLEEPENRYLQVSQAPAWSLLSMLEEIHPGYAAAVFRDACGLEPYHAAVKIRTWLRNHATDAAPVVSSGTNNVFEAFDFSIGSAEADTVQQLSAKWLARMERGKIIGVGCSGEIRFTGPYGLIPCSTDAFRVEGDDGPHWRTVHLGVDLYAGPGTPVISPFDGTIHRVAINSDAGDYGPTVIVKYDAEGVPFFILFGHLSVDSLSSTHPGMPVSKGTVIGRIGAFEENGNWPPHVHVQTILDLFGYRSSFPGLCRPQDKRIWFSLCPDPEIFLRTGIVLPGSEQSGQMLSLRREHSSRTLSLSYKKHLHIVRGKGQYLFNQNGRPYLDCVNNVCHVGHCNPRVVQAAQRQMALLNTNTRYLHRNLIEYAARLCAKLPDPLKICFFVNSGSEANDLALRLARAHTENKDVIVIDGAYHGNLTSLIEISPYKFDGPGGSGAAPYVHKMSMPDCYRGPYSCSDPNAGQKYAEEIGAVIRYLKEQGREAVTFIAESALSCGGQIILPKGYLKTAYEYVRKAGGVCIADEVQIGFGRAGTHFWGFETQEVIPDIVTMGKPMGNGHPMAAVVTTPAIAASFENGMEYFNTYGGNPVSCAIGLAVLDAIEEGALQVRAHDIGTFLLQRLQDLMNQHSIIGDVRGLGLFLGIELVEDRNTLTPAAKTASYIIERMKDRGVLLSVDGPLHNVLKIKPPLVFTVADAESLVSNLNVVLSEL